MHLYIHMYTYTYLSEPFTHIHTHSLFLMHVYIHMCTYTYIISTYFVLVSAPGTSVWQCVAVLCRGWSESCHIFEQIMCAHTQTFLRMFLCMYTCTCTWLDFRFDRSLLYLRGEGETCHTFEPALCTHTHVHAHTHSMTDLSVWHDSSCTWRMRHDIRMCVSHVTHTHCSESCDMWKGHVTDLNEGLRDVSHVWMSHICVSRVTHTYLSKPCHTWKGHIIYLNEGVKDVSCMRRRYMKRAGYTHTHTHTHTHTQKTHTITQRTICHTHKHTKDTQKHTKGHLSRSHT